MQIARNGTTEGSVGYFFNALSQQCAYTVDKRMLAAVEQRERESENMNECTVVKALSNG